MDLNIRTYKVVKCVICKTYQMTSAKTTFKCIKCQKTKPLKKMTIHYESDNPQKTTLALQKIKKEDFKQKNQKEDFDNLDDFSSAF